jgi:hypothetical protein
VVDSRSPAKTVFLWAIGLLLTGNGQVRDKLSQTWHRDLWIQIICLTSHSLSGIQRSIRRGRFPTRRRYDQGCAAWQAKGPGGGSGC